MKCPYCYLGARPGTAQSGLAGSGALSALREVVSHLAQNRRTSELALSVSEPWEPSFAALCELTRLAAGFSQRVTITTTMACALSLPETTWEHVHRLNLSVDEEKGPRKEGRVDPREVGDVLSRLPAQLEKVLIVTLSSQAFAERLLSGLLAELIAVPQVHKVALSALKPPPPFCDRAFWLSALSRLAPLLHKELHNRLFLDCYVEARILGLGDCPARPDLSPASKEEKALGPLAFRACVYQPEPDVVAKSPADLLHHLATFSAPKRCPFPID